MEFISTPLTGAYLIELNKKNDDRGFFARFFCVEEFKKVGLEYAFIQVNNSLSHLKGTLRGMHYQLHPKSETKIIRCIKGSLYDVIVDLRPESVTFGQSFGCELSANNRRMMYVPQGFAHGFVTLEDETEVIYMVSESYSPQHERGIRWNDPYFNIAWATKPIIISEKDLSHPDFNKEFHLKTNFK